MHSFVPRLYLGRPLSFALGVTVIVQILSAYAPMYVRVAVAAACIAGGIALLRRVRNGVRERATPTSVTEPTSETPPERQGDLVFASCVLSTGIYALVAVGTAALRLGMRALFL